MLSFMTFVGYFLMWAGGFLAGVVFYEYLMNRSKS